ncbi:MAG: serine dehydratase [Gracilibacter sp. BRH_c7a]|nr:MAG: serine dehydratase [Gracilibacter sp. BRH_c7a]
MKNSRVFDLLGPIMVGPSSSHTAGAVRLGLMAGKILATEIRKARILLHGSFAQTGKGHGTHLALIAGLLGMYPDDERIKIASQLAESYGVIINFENIDLGQVHPNSVKFELTGANGQKSTIIGSSLGGGKVIITEVDGFRVKFTGEYSTLIAVYPDYPGMIAEITTQVASAGVNIAQMKVSREGRGRKALTVIEADEVIKDIVVQHIKGLPKIEKVMYLEQMN